MRILALIENASSNRKLLTEHGLSFYIELNGKKILMDAGASERFIKNAKRMKVDLKELDAVIVSHNHRDHTGGLEGLLKLAPDVKIFAKKDVEGNYYRKLGVFNFVICWNKHFVNRHRKNFVLFRHFQEVTEDLYVMGCEIHRSENMLKDGNLLMKQNNRYVADDFRHELFAVAFPYGDKSKGCVVISSCSHSGIVNILETVKQTWLNSPILGVVGGFHLKFKAIPDGSFIKDLSGELARLSEGCVYTCHCTGVKCYEALKEYMGDQLQYLRTGEELTF